jgi:hypothetical protein
MLKNQGHQFKKEGMYYGHTVLKTDPHEAAIKNDYTSKIATCNISTSFGC